VKDLTKNSVLRHILNIAAPIAIGMVFQALYFLVDLYFIAQLGDAAIAGVSAAGNITAIVLALTQVLGAGALALVAYATGRKDQTGANKAFHQAILLALAVGALTVLAILVSAGLYLRTVLDTSEASNFGLSYLNWFSLGLGLQFVVVTISVSLRGTGNVRPAMGIQLLTVVINIILAPILITGWGTQYALGVAGAGMASSIAIIIGLIMLLKYVANSNQYLSISGLEWKPRFDLWRKMLAIGMPAGAEFLLIVVSTTVMYWMLQGFGVSAQAGLGLGYRVMQTIFLPAMAIAFAVGPVVGQNFGGGFPSRVRQAFVWGGIVSTAAMALVTVIAQLYAAELMNLFSGDSEAKKVGAVFLTLISWSFIAQGLVFTCSNVFMGLGNMKPVLWSATIRLVVFTAACVWLSKQPAFHIEQIWYAAAVTVVLQAALSWILLRIEFRKRLIVAPTPAATRTVATSP
jgi:putative MATE family efflux protein